MPCSLATPTPSRLPLATMNLPLGTMTLPHLMNLPSQLAPEAAADDAEDGSTWGFFT